ncbi:pentatricopeptide repeat-containing protein At1g71210, mitochondrial [Punica granatum]|uniref:Pentatricopeptide repeat-containing protein At1g71210, mitochondrial n=1 Tax=Punica granatum TaxID=22663 RepID=A0A6P8E6F2_PUNGR|nr:pentatricopeptide repeat-containing protein At1g71210, mitochondrial [Punica granatum]
MMIAIKHASRTRSLLHRSLGLGSGLCPSLSSAALQFSSLETAVAPTSPLHRRISPTGSLITKELVDTFTEWFQWGNNALLSRIFDILKADQGPDHSASDHALSQLNLRLTESFVLEVLHDGRRRPSGVLLCLKFFDWAGRQPQFYHTRATFHAMIKILAKAKRKMQMVDFLENIERHAYKLRFHDTLVMGYALAGKPDRALHLFGRMRFKGLDLDSYAYQVLLNALVEDNCFDAVKVLENQVSIRGIDSPFIHSVMIKSLCKQNQLDRATKYLHGLLREGKKMNAQLVATLIATLCKRHKFEQAHSLMEEFRELRVARMEDIYGIWLRELIRAGRLARAFEFFQSKKQLEGYVPDVFRYNMLIYHLLRKNRLWDVFDLLVEMKENKIPPDWETINVTLCFFCKMGMVDVALELHSSCSDFNWSPSRMFYNFLINALCDNKSTDEAYQIWKSSIASGYFPGKKSFGILTDALFRENKINEMMELVLAALEQNFLPNASTYHKFVLALCKARRVEEGYLLHREVSKIAKFSQRRDSFVHLIRALSRSNRGDMAATLLIDMQGNGHRVTLSLYKSVIQCLCNMDDPGRRVLTLLERQLSYSGPKAFVFNFIICGAGCARNPELAREVYEIMKRSGLSPSVTTDLLLLKSYLTSGRIFDALNFYGDIGQRRTIKRRLYTAMVVGLCEAGRTDYALEFFKEMRTKGFNPSIECYEHLIRLLCSVARFDDALKILDDFTKAGRRISSFIGNTLLWHSLITHKLDEAWLLSGAEMNGSPEISMLGKLIGASSGRIKMVAENVGNLEEVIKQCFRPNIYTYNLLLKILFEGDVHVAISYFDWICKKGLEPNRWTYEIIIRGLLKHGRRAEAKRWYDEMSRNGFTPSIGTRLLL